jgi:LysM repeat protein
MIEDIEPGEQDGTGDVYVTLTLREYREVSTVRVEATENGARAAEAPVVTSETYTVAAGDTLSAICRRFYGDASLYPQLASYNGIKNANIIYVGQVIELGSEWATIRSIIDVDMDVGALVGPDSFAGVITGEFSLMNQGYTRVTYLASGAEIFAGDEVLTSGKGGSFPAGLLIGTVSAVRTENGGQVTYGIVSPSSKLASLSQVFIIKDFAVVE